MDEKTNTTINQNGEGGISGIKPLSIDEQNKISEVQLNIRADDKSTVAVSGGNEKIPWWFIVLFILTLAAFIYMTSILILKINNKKSLPELFYPKPSVTPISQAAKKPSPAPVSKVDDVVTEMEKLSPSDEIGDIKSDLGKTDFNVIGETIRSIDKKIGFIPE